MKRSVFLPFSFLSFLIFLTLSYSPFLLGQGKTGKEAVKTFQEVCQKTETPGKSNCSAKNASQEKIYYRFAVNRTSKPKKNPYLWQYESSIVDLAETKDHPFHIRFNKETLAPALTMHHLNINCVDASRDASKEKEHQQRFAPDKRLPEQYQLIHDDFNDLKSVYNRGHLVPAGDFSCEDQRKGTYITSNIVPQNGKLNSGAWENLESCIRQTSKNKKKNNLVILTGSVFLEKDKEELLNQKIRIPSEMYKVIVDEDMTPPEIFVISAENKGDAILKVDTLDKVADKTGIIFLPRKGAFTWQKNLNEEDIKKSPWGKCLKLSKKQNVDNQSPSKNAKRKAKRKGKKLPGRK